jgi:DNA-binding MarR family transcriptional regulator
MSLLANADANRRAIHWLARLPFLGVSEAASLLGVNEARAASVLRELETLAWIEWIVPSSPELDARRLHVLTHVAQVHLAESEAGSWLPIGRRETLTRLARLETAVGLNRFIVELAAAAEEDLDADLADALALPWKTASANRHWPPAVEGYACLQWDSWTAPFFIAWDRAGAPPIHRRKRVAGWYSYAESHDWDAPSILVVCPSESEADAWGRAVVNSADRRGSPLLPVFLATVLDAQADPLGPIWRRADDTYEAHLCQRLRWVPKGSEPLPPCDLTDRLDVSRPSTCAPVQEWLPDEVSDLRRAARLDRLAALSRATTALQKMMLEWIAHHALLTKSDLAILMGVREPLAGKLVESLVERELVSSISPAIDAAGESRYVLTVDGLRLLAERDGVPVRRYLKYGIVVAPDPRSSSRRLETLVGQFDHTVGINRFFVRLKRDVDAQGGRLLRWLNSAESTERFWADGQKHWLRPDGYAEVNLGGEIYGLFLEWDRGTTRRQQEMIEKFHTYAAHFATGEEEAPSRLLVVTNSPHREMALRKLLETAFGDGMPRAFTTVDSLVERLGTLTPIWRSSEASGRVSWQNGGNEAD